MYLIFISKDTEYISIFTSQFLVCCLDFVVGLWLLTDSCTYSWPKISFIFMAFHTIFSRYKSHDYGWHQEREILVSRFFQFLVSRREMGDEKQEIDFLHFCLISAKFQPFFNDFSKYNDDNASYLRLPKPCIS